MKQKFSVSVVLTLTLLSVIPSSFAGTYSDLLKQCDRGQLSEVQMIQALEKAVKYYLQKEQELQKSKEELQRENPSDIAAHRKMDRKLQVWSKKKGALLARIAEEKVLQEESSKTAGLVLDAKNQARMGSASTQSTAIDTIAAVASEELETEQLKKRKLDETDLQLSESVQSPKRRRIDLLPDASLLNSLFQPLQTQSLYSVSNTNVAAVTQATQLSHPIIPVPLIAIPRAYNPFYFQPNYSYQGFQYSAPVQPMMQSVSIYNGPVTIVNRIYEPTTNPSTEENNNKNNTNQVQSEPNVEIISEGSVEALPAAEAIVKKAPRLSPIKKRIVKTLRASYPEFFNQDVSKADISVGGKLYDRFEEAVKQLQNAIAKQYRLDADRNAVIREISKLAAAGQLPSCFKLVSVGRTSSYMLTYNLYKKPTTETLAKMPENLSDVQKLIWIAFNSEYPEFASEDLKREDLIKGGKLHSTFERIKREMQSYFVNRYHFAADRDNISKNMIAMVKNDQLSQAFKLRPESNAGRKKKTE